MTPWLNRHAFAVFVVSFTVFAAIWACFKL